MNWHIKHSCMILISMMYIPLASHAQSNPNNPYCPHPPPCWEPNDDPSTWYGNNCCRPKPGFTAIPGEPCKHCDGRGGVMDKIDGYKPPNTHCKECKSGALVDIISTCKGASGWMPTSYPMQCGTCGPYALQARNLGRCDPVADCGCKETTHDFMRRVKLECNNPNYDIYDVAQAIGGCCGLCAALKYPPAIIACALSWCPLCACNQLDKACSGCKIVSFEVIQQRVGCL